MRTSGLGLNKTISQVAASMNHCFLKQITFKNYRCFPLLALDFHERLTVLVASNGGGKTAVLDGVAIALRLFVDTIEGRINSQGFSPKDVRLVLNPESKMEPVTPVRLDATGVLFGEPISWARERQSESTSSRTNTAEARELKGVALDLIRRNQEWAQGAKGETPLFPLVSFYGTGRLWSAGKLTEGKKTREPAPNARHRGYTDCLSSSSHYKYFVDWFRRFSYEARKLNPEQMDSPHAPEENLAAVRKAVDTALAPSGWRALEWDFAEDNIVAFHPELGRLPVDILSDGIRNMIGLVADIAHRAMRLNPHLGERAPIETPGVVLIDEVDMHLHPQWQQVVLRSLHEAFPLVQFIVTTHSPQVLTTVRKGNVRMLSQDAQGDWSAHQPMASPLGHEAGDALAYIMDTHPRPEIPEIMNDVESFERLARSGRGGSSEAQAIQQRLERAGFEFNEAERNLFEFLSRNRAPAEVNG